MQNGYFESGHATVGGRKIPFIQKKVQERFLVWIPQSFEEDTNLDYRYTYLSNTSKSPLGVALRFTPVGNPGLKDKMVASYFGHTEEVSERPGTADNRVFYRETTGAGTYMSIYSMRFAVDIADGIMFGCFNCSSDFESHWRDVVLQMLQAIEVLPEG